MLDEVQRAPRLEDTAYLLQCGGDVGDGAERPAGHDSVKAVVCEGQRLAVQTCPFHRNGRRPQALVGQLPGDVGGLNRGNSGDGRRVEGDVEPRAEADLYDVSSETLADPLAQRFDVLRSARDVHDPREDSLRVQPHDCLP